VARDPGGPRPIRRRSLLGLRLPQQPRDPRRLGPVAVRGARRHALGRNRRGCCAAATLALRRLAAGRRSLARGGDASPGDPRRNALGRDPARPRPAQGAHHPAFQREERPRDRTGHIARRGLAGEAVGRGTARTGPPGRGAVSLDHAFRRGLPRGVTALVRDRRAASGPGPGPGSSTPAPSGFEARLPAHEPARARAGPLPGRRRSGLDRNDERSSLHGRTLRGVDPRERRPLQRRRQRDLEDRRAASGSARATGA
jgi:hypothetical protein